ncbi:P-loop containing nucleoside triphosphate hydrolase protein [Polychytrium aggregatum]|uniref:P-loop containing nucleoside triphosphate hydrolase protein n=1 Tax=Polychytrium aggregatum TaxID=110093 RepID=UPI0022FECAD9|nr:P-loop containing nucleoside triphosphate hydrolase protein [Polychytrium aggregatum]KAI9209768.1 P-loop containing nucleoside triphosphate hydrolase protein [Polychytrium aggregatum]
MTDASLVEKALKEYTKGTKAYFPDEAEGWIVATVTSKSIEGDQLRLTFNVDQRNKNINLDWSLAKLQASNFADLPPLKNPPMLEGTDDLATLSYLHEAAVLHGIKTRYLQEQIYTYSGIVLIAMNPFQRLSLYSPDIMREYSGKDRGELEPHLYAVAEDAYRTLIKEARNQSIIVSGESGAGKTQSAKYIMRYFATVDNLGNYNSHEAAPVATTISEVEEAVLATNPILEAFGNSKTTRNDNSSRFGKYIEVLFSNNDKSSPRKGVHIVGAKIRTYLLERSRLIFQPATERNYHIFYQLCAAAPAAEKKELGLTGWDSFFYLKQGGTGTVPGFDDVAEFANTQKALSIIGISVSQQWDIFRICAALLHIGNIEIKTFRDEASVDDNDPALAMASKLLGVDKATFKKWIVKKQIITRSEKIVSSLNQYQATVARDSVAKFVYSMLFDWIVRLINKNLAKDGQAYNSFIGVLDIYGFEHFKKNSFEQFCINYANEKLQQEFNAHVFRLEQEIYVQEKINWSFIDFNDNQPCIDMIENKLGILDLLDEESRLPSGADASLVTKLYQRFAVPTQKFFEKPKFGQKAFTIKHYACDVTYDIDGFIEKNKDTVADEQLATLNSSEFAFLREVVAIEATPEPEPTPNRPVRGGALKKPTLGSIFKASLVQLMETIRSTQVHYIRCIKPNSTKTPFGFEPQMVLQQLRACGVLETIRISCAGYPSKYTFQEFADRYYPLVASNQWNNDSRQLTEIIVTHRITDLDKYQLGLTKIFFRAGQIAILEKLRTERIRYCVVLIQKNIKKFIYQRSYVRTRAAAIQVQTALRAWSARQQMVAIRENLAAIKLQAAIREYLARSKYVELRTAATVIQGALRLVNAQKEFHFLRITSAAVRIQKVFRGYSARKTYKYEVAAIVLLQSYVRRLAPVKEFSQLKQEAKSVGKLKEINYRLEGKVVELSQALKEQELGNKLMSEEISHLKTQVGLWKEKFSKSDLSNKAVKTEYVDTSTELKKELQSVTEAKEALVRERERDQTLIKKQSEDIRKFELDLEKHKEELTKLRDELKTTTKGEDPAVVMGLRKEVSSLREQMARLIAGKWRSDRVADSQLVSNDGDSWAYSSYDGLGEAQPQPRLRTPSSYLESPDSLERRRTPAPSARTIVADSPETERSIRILEDKALEDEILDSLVTNLRIPLPSTQTVATRSEIFFPSHLIGLVATQLAHFGLAQRLQVVMGNTLKAIQGLTTRFEDDYVSAFWLSNCHELLCILNTPDMRNQGFSLDLVRGLESIQKQLEYIVKEVYSSWIKELRKRLDNTIIPAIIETQSLPGYVCKQSGNLQGSSGKFSKVGGFTTEQLLNFLSKLSKTMKCYYLSDSITQQILSELIRVIGVTAFNHLLMRRNFCTWKRGVQIQYNISRLEEWCTGQNIPEAAKYLQHILQAAKLLTLNKSSAKDIEAILENCPDLNATQIKKLLSLYYAADFDSPLSPELLKVVSSRASLNEKSDVLLLDLEKVSEFNKPSMRHIEAIDKFVPSWMNLPCLAAVTTLAQ